jgi:hypothetical protein
VALDYRTLINRDLPIVERACTSKAAYVSRGEARAYLRHSRRSDGGMAPYLCRHCDLWRLGHSRKRAH